GRFIVFIVVALAIRDGAGARPPSLGRDEAILCRPMTTAEQLKEHLTVLSRNLWWSWNPQIIKLFRDLDTEAFRASNHNPVMMLGGFTAESYDRLAKD